jgi:hypothetical protein
MSVVPWPQMPHGLFREVSLGNHTLSPDCAFVIVGLY